MKISPSTLAKLVGAGVGLVLARVLIDKLLLRATSTVVRREVPRR